MITTGRQIAAARALLGWSQDELADAAAMHVNSVAYWERHSSIPTDHYKAPIACRRIREALFKAGVETFVDPSPGVRLSARNPAKSSLHAPEVRAVA
ncbi:MAG: helix-turn-helix transcriptional regulator [Proteobacteria bacterium]|nr:helix-turn-helix transcriptional regulator [Pseudomonadota bacterium]